MQLQPLREYAAKAGFWSCNTYGVLRYYFSYPLDRVVSSAQWPRSTPAQHQKTRYELRAPGGFLQFWTH
jgi:hypothetical protein